MQNSGFDERTGDIIVTSSLVNEINGSAMVAKGR
jgi:hypothetical protein